MQPNLVRQQQQQRQQKATTSSATTTTTTTTIRDNNNSHSQQQQLNTPTSSTAQQPINTTLSNKPRGPKIIKSKRPLIHFRFYIDVRDQQLNSKLENQVKELGGALEFFLGPNVTHFVSDKTVLTTAITLASPSAPKTPLTPHTPIAASRSCEPAASPVSYNSPQRGYGTTSNAIAAGATSGRQTRAQSILQRAQRNISSTTVEQPPATITQRALRKNNAIVAQAEAQYINWTPEQALRFFERLTTDLNRYLQPTAAAAAGSNTQAAAAAKAQITTINLKSGNGFIKLETNRADLRPYFHKFQKPDEWPRIDLQTDGDGAFSLSKQEQTAEKMTRKSRSRPSQCQQSGLLKTTTNKANAKDKPSSQLGGRARAKKYANTNSTAQPAAKETSQKQQCGVCEICKIEYDTLTIHLKTKDHETYARNAQNFMALDNLIKTSADVNTFLEVNNSLEAEAGANNSAEHELEVELNPSEPLDESVQQQHTRSSSRRGAMSAEPPLRERSKRSTKGKHSSERYQNIFAAISPPKNNNAAQKTPEKLTNASTSPKKKASTPTNTPTKEVIEQMATPPPTLSQKSQLPTKARRTTSSASTLLDSPPKRAMLPPSSLYKVVETSEATRACTPLKKLAEEVAQAPTVASPIIVKFKRVRQAEENRLLNEAESFIFAQKHTSDPTDADRHTTSERTRRSMSSFSLESSEASSQHLGSDLPRTASARARRDERRRYKKVSQLLESADSKDAADVATTRALAVASRRKLAPKQCFPNTPIQPEIANKRGRLSLGNFEALEAASVVQLPEATRKSSRTATAIVTAATTSSRLLRAAVEAAKVRRLATERNSLSNTSSHSSTRANSAARRSSVRPKNQKLEDGMGEVEAMDVDVSRTTAAPTETETKPKVQNAKRKREPKMYIQTLDVDFDSDELEDDDEGDFDDHDSDEDYVHRGADAVVLAKSPIGTRLRMSSISHSAKAFKQLVSDSETEQREVKKITASKEAKDSIGKEIKQELIKANEKSGEKPKRKYVRRKLPLQKQSPKKAEKESTALSDTSKSTKPKRSLDLSKCELLPKHVYAFERVPSKDLYYSVFARQDACEERVFEYYGTTKYRKLPYEMGPVPYKCTVKPGFCCKLCERPQTQTNAVASSSKHAKAVRVKEESKLDEGKDLEMNGGTTHNKSLELTATAMPSSSRQHVTHKKLHLQRYQQEQQLLLSRKNKLEETPLLELKAEPAKLAETEPAPSRRSLDRANSVHSNTSSRASSQTSAATSSSKINPLRQKLLNLELPPRKSPREHASTLALVSSIRQRQDSLSKPNSETEELPRTPTSITTPEEATMLSTVATNLDEAVTVTEQKRKETEHMPNDTTVNVEEKVMGNATPNANLNATFNAFNEKATKVATPRSPITRTMSGTPIEEMRFATEISETVKRMRRGQNKYDHSPSFLSLPMKSPARNLAKKAETPPLMLGARKKGVRSLNRASPLVTAGPTVTTAMPTQKRSYVRRRPVLLPASKLPLLFAPAYKLHNYTAHKNKPTPPTIRKTGSKKGVVEYEMDAAALQALEDVDKDYINVRQLEKEIDHYLESTAIDCEVEMEHLLTPPEEIESADDTQPAKPKKAGGGKKRKSKSKAKLPAVAAATISTPPPTDIFSSEFDLCDLVSDNICSNASLMEANNGNDNNNQAARSSSSKFSLYNSMAFQSYFTKRKSLKTNRTGWPKAQRRKMSGRQRPSSNDKVNLLNIVSNKQRANAQSNIGLKQEKLDEELIEIEEPQEEQNIASGSGAMTPPYSDLLRNCDELSATNTQGFDNNTEGEEEEYQEALTDMYATAENLHKDADGAETPHEGDGHESAMDVDAENEAEDEALNVAEHKKSPELAAESENEEVKVRRVGWRVIPNNTGKRYKKRGITKTKINTRNSTVSKSNEQPSDDVPMQPNTSSTPTLDDSLTRNHSLRHTPQLLNGSLLSCVSPSEKAGDNSDIFTVSSDGLDTDLDLSNSQRAGVEDNSPNMLTTPKKRFDLAKYATSNSASRQNLAEVEAAKTAALKSMAISQFLKKEVKVQCRRIRAPFRRFRAQRR